VPAVAGVATRVSTPTRDATVRMRPDDGAWTPARTCTVSCPLPSTIRTRGWVP